MLKTLHIAIAFLFVLGAFHAHAQTDVTVSFDKHELQIHAAELLSNVVKITNNTNSEIQVNLTVDFPYEWKQLGEPKKQYTIAAFDSVFVPVRLIPTSLMGGNNKYMINANVLTINDKYITGSTFWAFTKKQSSWRITPLEGNKIYFKNGKNEATFHLNIINTGSETQPIAMTLNNLSLFSAITDSAGALQTLKPINVKLGYLKDTSFGFIYKYESGERNVNRIDIENYKPTTSTEEKTFNLFVNTEEPNFGQEGSFSANQRIVFKKLSDNTKSNPNAFSHLPLVVDYNVSNLLDNISFSTLNIRGNAQVNPNAQIMYNLQTGVTSDRPEDAWKNTNYYFGYFHTRGNLQLGFINGGIMGLQSFGKGVKAGVYLTKRSLVSAFYVTNSDKNGEQYLESKGTSLQYRYFRQNKILVEYGVSDNKATRTSTKALNTRTGLNFLKTQTINVSFSNTWNATPLHVNQVYGYFYMLNYGGSFFKNKFNTNHGFGKSQPEYSNSNIARTFYNHRSRYMFSEAWSVTLVNNYNKTASRVYFNANLASLNNQVSVTKSFKFQSLQLAGMYNIFEFANSTNFVKAISLNTNSFKPKEFTRFSANIEAGINSATAPGYTTQDIAYLTCNTILFYKTLTVNSRYTMGAYGSTPVVGAASQGITQQLFSSSVQHQYVFSNTKFMLQTGLNYYYNNIFKQSTINLFPELYYFTSNGWRFRAGINYNLISGNSLQNAYNRQNVTEEPDRVTTQGLFVSLGIRREFSLPVPFKKQHYIDSEFSVFFDVNGNGIKDKNERAIENVVIRVNEDEVLTNERGEAKISDAASGIAKIGVLPLDNIDGWFANISDSVILLKNKTINIPFVKGVKIKGRVSIQREQLAVDADEPFDLSRIKITAYGTKNFSTLTGFDGAFEFYLPFGEYTISFDETILGDKFKLTKNHYNVSVTKDADGLVISYHIIEKTRKVNKKVFKQ